MDVRRRCGGWPSYLRGSNLRFGAYKESNTQATFTSHNTGAILLANSYARRRRRRRLAGGKRSAGAGTLPYMNRALERAPDTYRSANQIESGVPAGTRKSSMTCPRWLRFASPAANIHRPYQGSKQLPEFATSIEIAGEPVQVVRDQPGQASVDVSINMGVLVATRILLVNPPNEELMRLSRLN